MSAEIHKYDIGTAITIAVRDCEGIVDLSSASSIRIKFLKPDKTSLTVTATLVNSGTDGLIRYITASGDLNVVGMWSYEVLVTVGSNFWSSDVGTFRVYSNI
jgi:hypothetical protein